MTLLAGDVASFFAAAFAPFYIDAKLYRPVDSTDDGKGGGSGGGFLAPEIVKAQLDQATYAMRSSDAYVEGDQRILVLASGVATITTDCEIEIGGVRWQIGSVSQDPATAYYELRGRRKADA